MVKSGYRGKKFVQILFSEKVIEKSKMLVNNYELLEDIGHGSFSTVYKAQHTETKELYAIKMMRQMPHNDERVVKNEIELLKRLKHDNIVKYIDDFRVKRKWYIVFEYCGKGDLNQFKNKIGRFPQFFCKNIAYSFVQALSILHKDNIVHRDLKLANILINNNYELKLADFGFSKDNEDGMMQSFCGSPFAMAPEILNREPYDKKCDTWALGVLLYSVIYDDHPYGPGGQFGPGIIGLTNCIQNTEPKYPSNIEVSKECKDFIKLCLRKNRRERPNMNELSHHPWINIAIESKVGKDFIKNNLLNDREEIVKRAREIIHGAVKQHIERLVQEYKLAIREIKENLQIFAEYYPKHANIRQLIIMMVMKIIKELLEDVIHIQIEQSEFIISLADVKSFRQHAEIVKQQLQSQFETGKKSLSIEREIITFVVDESQSCLKLTEDYPKKIKLILNLSTMPINCSGSSKVKISQSFNELQTQSRKIFAKYLEKQVTKETVLTFINEQGPIESDIHDRWLIEHEFRAKKREGEQIEIGQFISRLIQINNDE